MAVSESLIFHRLPSHLFVVLLLFVFCIATVNTYNYPGRPLEVPRFLTKKSCSQEGDGCRCLHRQRGECCCKGRSFETLPSNLTSSVRVLIIYNTSLETISSTFFDQYPKLEEIEIFSLPNLRYFDATSLRNLTNLKKFSLTWCKSLEEISGILLEKNRRMQALILRDNGLKRMPGLLMTDDHHLEVEVDLSGNEIQYIGDGRVSAVRARSLRLNHNRLKEIAGYAFRGSSFVKLHLNNNKDLTDLSIDAFREISEMHHLYLSDTSITVLPIHGLKNLKSLNLKNVPTLKKLPSVLSFTHLETAHFTYPHHCCLFKYIDDVVEGENGMYKSNMNEIHHRICKQKQEKQTRKKRETILTTAENFNFNSFFDQNFFDVFVDDDTDELPEFPPDMLGASTCASEAVNTTVRGFYHNITCTPQPDPLNPCENIVGYPLLRRAIWFVWVLAIVGNMLVWVSLCLAYEKRMRVHYILMFSLSIADLLTGVFLGILAIQDVKTSDEYYRHAVGWQTGWGCQTAGFLAVFASILSIISMFLIAFEMAYNTRMAFYGKRLKLRGSLLLLAGGWIYAFIMASLPLFGVSSYSTTSICLPLRAVSFIDKTYIIFALLFNFMAFIGMVLCYVFIIWLLKNPNTPSREEDKAVIAKMSLLIGTDLICWFPAIFFGLTAAMGLPLISISNAKVFLVFFYPLNAFANPFLYVFLTEVIRRKVKSKTIPVLRKITSSPGVALTSLSNFYHSQPPGRREEPSTPTRLQVTQMTSLNSTPRGSACSGNNQKTVDSIDCLEITIPKKRNSSSPRVSFQDDSPISPKSPTESTRRSVGILKKISAIPEVSDLSEHSSESHHEHVPKDRDDDKPLRFSLNRFFHRYRHESSHSIGQDSGRGSITSTGTRSTERQSVVSGSSDGESTLFIPKIITPRKDSKPLRKLSPMPRRLIDRRQSAPIHIGRPLLTVTDCS